MRGNIDMQRSKQEKFAKRATSYFALKPKSNWSTYVKTIFSAIEDRNKVDLLKCLNLGSSDMINTHGGVFRETPLHRAAQNGWSEGIKVLLDHGSILEVQNHYKQSPLHYAVVAKSHDCVRILLNASCKSSFVNMKDLRGHTALHDAAAESNVQILKILLSVGADINVVDDRGMTPLHKAVQVRSIDTISYLLKSGADLKAKDKQGMPAVVLLLKFFPKGFETLLDKCFEVERSQESSFLEETGVTFTFSPLLTSDDKGYQVDVVREILKYDTKNLILHPICQTFLLLQWLSVRKIFLTEIALVFLYSTLTSIYILNKYVWIRTVGTFPEYIDGRFQSALFIMCMCGSILFLLKQIIVVICSIKVNLLSSWSILSAIVPVLVLIVAPGKYHPWQEHVAIIVLLLIWIQCMFHIGRFPNWGIYITMFTTVAKNLIRIFAIFFCVFIAFTLTFNLIVYSKHTIEITVNNTVIITDDDPTLSTNDVIFSNLLLAFIKIVIMMIGELNFDESVIQVLNYVPYTSHLVFICFVFFISIALSNLLVALAVSDVQLLRTIAERERLVQQAELIFHVETFCELLAMCFSIIGLNRLSEAIFSWNYVDASTSVYLRLNYPRDEKLYIRSIRLSKTKVVNVQSSFIDSVCNCIEKNRTPNPVNKNRIPNVSSLTEENIKTLQSNIVDLKDICLKLDEKIDKLKEILVARDMDQTI